MVHAPDRFWLDPTGAKKLPRTRTFSDKTTMTPGPTAMVRSRGVAVVPPTRLRGTIVGPMPRLACDLGTTRTMLVANVACAVDADRRDRTSSLSSHPPHGIEQMLRKPSEHFAIGFRQLIHAHFHARARIHR
jgi:hypothetical protein